MKNRGRQSKHGSQDSASAAGLGCRVACDSLVALGCVTEDGVTRFAKNSDRPAMECQPLVQMSQVEHSRDATVRCQYIEIPQVRRTAAIIGARPYWLWGFEHGLNEYGVAIGNHTVFTRDPVSTSGLTGMDLVRLSLERARTAREAVTVITEILETHTQGGSGYIDKDWPYYNSFLIADPSQAYLVETSGRHWAVRRIHDAGSTSNHLTIGRDWDALSADAISHAISSNWWPESTRQRFDFAAAYRDTSLAPGVVSNGRYRRTCKMLQEQRGQVSDATLMAALRDHYGGPMHAPERTVADEEYFAVCMHAEPVGTTTASVVARLRRKNHGISRFSASLGSPCVGIFLPFYIGVPLPEAMTTGAERVEKSSAWWRFKQLLALLEHAPAEQTRMVRTTWDRLESEMQRRADSVEEEAFSLQQRGHANQALELLRHFTTSNTKAALDQLDQLIVNIESA